MYPHSACDARRDSWGAKCIAVGLKLLALRSTIKSNYAFGRQVRRQFDIDGQHACEVMKEARIYGAGRRYSVGCPGMRSCTWRRRHFQRRAEGRRVPAPARSAGADGGTNWRDRLNILARFPGKTR
jgi:hypothetical protein